MDMNGIYCNHRYDSPVKMDLRLQTTSSRFEKWYLRRIQLNSKNILEPDRKDIKVVYDPTGTWWCLDNVLL